MNPDCSGQETDNRAILQSPTCCHDLTNAGGHCIAVMSAITPSAIVVSPAVVIRKQRLQLIVRLVVNRPLAVNERARRRKDVDRSIHICVD